MLSTRPLSTPSSCVRCQLRQIIFGSRSRARILQPSGQNVDRSRGFRVSHCRSQRSEEDDEQGEAFLQTDHNNGRRKMIYRREFPLGRVVGQPGRRQRESSETLNIDSMNHPFDVVLMRDVPEPKEQQSLEISKSIQGLENVSRISAAEIASELLKNRPPDQSEINESIDALRPNASIIDRQQFDDLLKQLFDGYNTVQLSRYLLKSHKQLSEIVEQAHAPHEQATRGKRGLQMCPWQPGRMPIEQRHRASSISKTSEHGTKKRRIVEQILRHKWDLVIQSEEQQIGELEIPLERWQIEYLLSLHFGNKQHYETIIQPPLLLRHAEILPYKPDNIIRIVARRRDAEEIARQVRSELHEVHKLVFHLTVFKPLLGQPWWPKTLRQLLPESDLNYVAQHTMNIIERQDENTINIYGRSRIGREHGQRLLLSLLKLPSATDVTILEESAVNRIGKESINDKNSILLPERPSHHLHSRYYNSLLSRRSVPIYRLANDSLNPSYNSKSKSQLDQDKSTLVKYLAEKLDATNRHDYRSFRQSTSAQARSILSGEIDPHRRDSYWEASEIDISPWEAQFCRILQPSGNNPRLSTVQPDVPGVNTLLSYFTPQERKKGLLDTSKRAPYLIAHFFPSPFTHRRSKDMHKLPRLELRYDFSDQQTSMQSTGTTALQLSEMKAILHQQEFHLPLPCETSDLCMVQRVSLRANSATIQQDEEIKRFTHTLYQSVSRSNGALAGEPVLKIRLPLWVAKRGGLKVPSQSHSGLVKVEYYFERFEQVQAAEFAPVRPDGFMDAIDPGMQQILDNIPESSFLEYRDIEGGLIGGTRAELSLKYDVPVEVRVKNHEQRPDESNLRFAQTALGLVTSLSRINAGELRPLRTLHTFGMGSD